MTWGRDWEDLEEKVIIWGDSKEIIRKEYAQVQMIKMTEEVDELLSEVLKNDMKGIKDELGDVLVTCIIQAECHGLSATECLETAYNKIYKRKGTMVDGVFIKHEVPHDAG